MTSGSSEAWVGEDERFEAKIGSYEAGTGFTITVRESLPTGDFLEAVLADIAFGEVWLL